MQQIQHKLIQTNVNETQLTTVKIEMNIIINHILIIQKTRNATIINLTKEEITITQDHQLIIIHVIKIAIIAPKQTKVYTNNKLVILIKVKLLTKWMNHNLFSI